MNLFMKQAQESFLFGLELSNFTSRIFSVNLNLEVAQNFNQISSEYIQII